MAKKSLLLIGVLFLIGGMTGLADAGTHADCIKNCIDIRTSAGADCKREHDTTLKQCDAAEVACVANAKDDAAKRACRKVNLECKAGAKDNYSKCIKSADAAVKKCKDECPPDKKPNISTKSTPGQMAPGQPGTSGEPAGGKVKTGNINLGK